MDSKTRFVVIVCVLFVSMLLLTSSVVSQETGASVKGFLGAWGGSKSVTCNSACHGYTAIDVVRTGTNEENFSILAPKEGVVVALNDNSDYGGTCSGAVYAANYIVLGHGTTENGAYDHYSLYLHLAHDSIPNQLRVGSRVQLGENIGNAGNTGLFGSSRPLSDPDRGTHLHMEVSRQAPRMISGNVTQCMNSVGVLPVSPRSIPNFRSRSSFGFEEEGNTYLCLSKAG